MQQLCLEKGPPWSVEKDARLVIRRTSIFTPLVARSRFPPDLAAHMAHVEGNPENFRIPTEKISSVLRKSTYKLRRHVVKKMSVTKPRRMKGGELLNQKIIMQESQNTTFDLDHLIWPF